MNIDSALSARLDKVTALAGHEPHPSWGGWRNYIEHNCELRDEVEDTLYFGDANCNYIVFPTNELLENYGYHGWALMTRIKEEGWRPVLAALKRQHEEMQALLQSPQPTISKEES